MTTNASLEARTWLRSPVVALCPDSSARDITTFHRQSAHAQLTCPRQGAQP